jgi:DNA-directed RNA polymerase specialized sigma24 family protein
VSINPYRFPTTRWSELAAIRDGPTKERCEALTSLAERYRVPVLAYLIADTRDPILAEDLAQDFFLWALEKDFFARADEDRGRFRSFLLRSLEHFRVSEHRKQSAQMRTPPGGFVEPNPLGVAPEAIDAVTPAAIYERAWVWDVIEKAVEQLKKSCIAAGREVRFKILQDYLVDPALKGSERPTMAALSKKYRVTTKQVETWLNWGKDALKDELLQEIGIYSRSPEEQAEELAGLLAAVNAG